MFKWFPVSPKDEECHLLLLGLGETKFECEKRKAFDFGIDLCKNRNAVKCTHYV